MKKIVFSILILIVNLSLSQERSVKFKNGVFNNNLEHFALLKINSKYNNEYTSKTNGSYYLNKKWNNKCVIQLEDGTNISIKNCNFNIFDSRFEYFIDNNLYFLKKENIKTVKINSIFFKPLKETTKNQNYYQELHTFSNFKLIKLYNIKKSSVPSKVSLGLYENKIYSINKKYLLFPNKIVKLPKTKKKILSLFKINLTKEKFKSDNIKSNEGLISFLKKIN